MSSYMLNRHWADQFLPQIGRIVGPHLLHPSTFEVDTQHATDLVMVSATGLDLACRVRRPGYADKYPFEFTVRSRTKYGAKTELPKLVDGCGDWMFYGHADESETIWRWWLINLDAFRAAMVRVDCIRHRAADTIPNPDGSGFVAFDLREFPESPPILIDGSHPVETQTAIGQ